MTRADSKTRTLSPGKFQGLFERLKRYGHFEPWMSFDHEANFPFEMVAELFRQDSYLAARVRHFVPNCRSCGDENIHIAFINEVTRTNGNFGLVFTRVPKFLNCDSCGQVYYTSRWLDEIRTLQERLETEERSVSWKIRSFMFANYRSR